MESFLEMLGEYMAAKNWHAGVKSLLADTHTCDESLLTKQQLGEKVKLSMRSIDRHVTEGKMPKGFLLGGARRWRLAEIDQWIACGCPIVDR